MLRVLFLICGAAIVYVLLRGWPEGMSPLFRGCFAVLVFIGGLSFWSLGKHWKRKGEVTPFRKVRWMDICVVLLGIFMLEALLLWMFTAMPGPLEAVAHRIELATRPESAGKSERLVTQSPEEGGGGDQDGNWLWTGQQERRLPLRTDLAPGSDLEVFVRLEKGKDAERLLGSQLYVRAFALDQFEGGTWRASESEGVVRAADPQGWTAVGRRVPDEIVHEVMLIGESGGGALVALQGLRAVKVSELQVMGSGNAGFVDGEEQRYQYFASSFPMNFDRISHLQKSVVSAVEREQSREFRELAIRAAGEGDLFQKLHNIKEFLQSEYDYSLSTENRANRSALDNFLFEEKRGHCEHFATAAALMARAIGVSSRVAYGWAGGQYYPTSRTFVFREREAHAWAEIEVEGYGWVTFEATPEVVMSGGGQPRIAGAEDVLPEVQTLDAGVSVKQDTFESSWIPISGAVIFGTVLLLLFFIRGRTGNVRSYGAVVRGLPSEQTYMKVWRKVCSGRKGATLAAQIRDLGEAAPEFSADLLRYHYDVTYGARKACGKVEKDLTMKIQTWAENR